MPDGYVRDERAACVCADLEGFDASVDLPEIPMKLFGFRCDGSVYLQFEEHSDEAAP